MPIPNPNKHESKNTYVSRCTSAIWDEYKGVQGQAVAICETQWKKHKAKASLVINAGDDEYVVTPEGKEEKTFQVQGQHGHVMIPPAPGDETTCPICDAATVLVGKKKTPFTYAQCSAGHTYLRGQAVRAAMASNTDPINDNGATPAPKPANPAPPAVPFPAKVSPVDSQPNDSKVPTKPKGDNSTDDDLNPENVGGASPAKLGDKQPKDGDILEREKRASNPPQDQIKNPEGGGLAPNPDDSTVPSGGQAIDSLDDHSAKPKLDSLQWFMGCKGLELKMDPDTGFAKWPLEFKVIERDFKRPNKPGNPDQEPKTNSQDAVEEDKKEKPYVI